MINPLHYGKGIDILIYLSENQNRSMQDISWETKVTYSYIHGLIHELTTKDLIEYKKEGRKKIVALTKKGKEVAKRFIEAKQLVNSK